MKSRLLRLSLFIALVLAGTSAAFASTVTGEVRNGTTGAPGAGLDVILIQLQGGMQPLESVKSDAQGKFHFDRLDIGAQPMLIRVIYHGVNYHQPLPPGTSAVTVEVYEQTEDPKSYEISQRSIFFQPNGANLLVGEEFQIVNHTKPSVTYYNVQGTLEFIVPEGAQLNQVSAWSASGMPVVQGTIDKGKNHYAVAFPFRPGESGVRLSYQLAYPSNQASLQTTSPYALQRVLLAVPGSVQMTSEGFAPAGTQQGWNLYARENIPASTALNVSVSGTAPMPAAGESGGGDQDPSVNSRSDSGAGESVHQLPARLEELKWVLVGGFVGVFVLGALFLWHRSRSESVPAVIRAPAKDSGARTVAEVDRAVAGSLDQLKENLFRIELRRQAGTISEEEYARQRARAEKVLRDLVKG